jgi:hypothetical protein
VGRRPITARQDFFFVAWIAQFTAYMLISPAMGVQGEREFLQNQYAYFEVVSTLLFLLPAILTYRFLRRTERPLRPVEFKLSGKTAWAAAIGLLLYEAVYVIFLFRTDSVFRRIGTYEAAEQRASMDAISLFALRSFEFAFLPGMMLLLFFQFCLHKNTEDALRARRVLRVPLIAWGVLYLILGLLNSRLALLFGSLLLGGVILLYSRKTFSRRGWALVIVLHVIALYAISVVMNLRILGLDSDLSEILNPTAAFNSSSYDFDHEWVRRLDGVDLIERVSEESETIGFANGKAWVIPAYIMLTQFVNPAASIEYKAQARTTAKSYLLERYTYLDPGDYPSCCLTDLYGNFGFWSFPVAGSFLAYLFAAAARLTMSARSSVLVCVGMFLSVHLIQFEQEFISLLLGWIRLVPSIVFLGMMLRARPIQIPDTKELPEDPLQG